jgi:adenylylsulfate kinase-like enzyme
MEIEVQGNEMEIEVQGATGTGKSIIALLLETQLKRLGAQVVVQDEELSEETLVRKKNAIKEGRPLLEGITVTVRTKQTPVHKKG